MKNNILRPGVAIIPLAVWSVWAGQSAIFCFCLGQIWLCLQADDRLDDKNFGSLFVCTLGVSGLLGCMVTGFTGMVAAFDALVITSILSAMAMDEGDD